MATIKVIDYFINIDCTGKFCISGKLDILIYMSNTVLFARGTDGDGIDLSHNSDADDGSADNTKQNIRELKYQSAVKIFISLLTVTSICSCK